MEVSRKRTANVKGGLVEIRRLIEILDTRSDARKDSFAKVLRKATTEKLGEDAGEVRKVLSREDLPKGLIKEALSLAQSQEAFMIFALVDAVTRLGQNVKYACDRAELDQKIGQLLALALAA